MDVLRADLSDAEEIRELVESCEPIFCLGAGGALGGAGSAVRRAVRSTCTCRSGLRYRVIEELPLGVRIVEEVLATLSGDDRSRPIHADDYGAMLICKPDAN